MTVKRISDSLASFAEALEHDKAVACDKRGKWHTENIVVRVVRWIFRLEEGRLVDVTKVFNKFLDELEHKAVKFGVSLADAQKQRQCYSNCMKAAEGITKAMHAHKYKKKESVAQLSLLQQKITALKYRIERENGGLNKKDSPEAALVPELKKKVEAWKKKEPMFMSTELTSEDLRRIDEACCHPEFAKILLKDHRMQMDFFKWVFRDNNGVSQFIQYPAIYRRLKSALLAGRIGRFCKGKMLEIEKRDRKKKEGLRKIISLPFAGKKVSLLNESKEVTLENDWNLTVKKVLDMFANKNNDPERVEFFGEGVGLSNWHVHKHGRFNPTTNKYDCIDYSKPEYWWDFPVFEKITKKQLEDRYRLPEITGEIPTGHWVALAKSTRQRASLDVDESHGYLGVAIPCADGKYQIFDFGKFAETFPTGAIARTFFITDTLKSRISYPDENTFYSHRQKASVPHVLTPEKGRQLMDVLRRYLILAREGNLVFQFAWENCAYLPQKVLEKTLGKEAKGGAAKDFFKMYLLDVQPSNKILAKVFRWIRKKPEKNREKWIRMIEFVLATWRSEKVKVDGKVVKKSVSNSKFRTTRQAYVPARLHERILDPADRLKGMVTFGHQAMILSEVS